MVETLQEKLYFVIWFIIRLVVKENIYDYMTMYKSNKTCHLGHLIVSVV